MVDHQIIELLWQRDQAGIGLMERTYGSFDYACAQTKNRGVTGYDLTTVLGSDLTFTGQTAQLTGWEQVEIVRQNFGFDPENGITQVPLTLEHYYLEVR